VLRFWNIVLLLRHPRSPLKSLSTKLVYRPYRRNDFNLHEVASIYACELQIENEFYVL
jgi:hypothetical protein